MNLGQIVFIFKEEIGYAHYPQIYPLSPTSPSLYPTHTTLSNIRKHFYVEKFKQRKTPSVQRTLGVKSFTIPLVSLSGTESPP